MKSRWTLYFRNMVFTSLLLTIGLSTLASGQENQSPSSIELLSKWIKECKKARSVVATKSVCRETYSDRFAKGQEELFKTKNLIGIDRTYFLHEEGKKFVNSSELRFASKPEVPTDGTRVRSVVVHIGDNRTFLNSYSYEGEDFRIEHTMQDDNLPSLGVLDIFAYIPGWSLAIETESIEDVYRISEEYRKAGEIEFQVEIKPLPQPESGPLFGMPAKPKAFSVVFAESTDWLPARFVIESEQSFNLIVEYSNYKQTSVGATLPHFCVASITDERVLRPQKTQLINKMDSFELVEFREASISEVDSACDPYKYMGVSPIASRPSNLNWLWFVIGGSSIVLLILIVVIRIRSK